MTQVMSSFVTIIVAGASSQVCPSKTPCQPFCHVIGIPPCVVRHSLVDEEDAFQWCAGTRTFVPKVHSAT